MPRNVEIKVRLADFPETARLARLLAEGDPEALDQEDVFFPCTSGRLKLRIHAPDRGELIYYERPDHPGPRTSQYRITPTRDPAGLRAILTAAHGIRAVVRKHRILLLAGRTRIHLDRVENLGDFLELEVVLRDGELAADGEAEARLLMSRLGVDPADLIAAAYVDLLEAQLRG